MTHTWYSFISCTTPVYRQLHLHTYKLVLFNNDAADKKYLVHN
jgi:hypothetical protein